MPFGKYLATIVAALCLSACGKLTDTEAHSIISAAYPATDFEVTVDFCPVRDAPYRKSGSVGYQIHPCGEYPRLSKGWQTILIDHYNLVSSKSVSLLGSTDAFDARFVTGVNASSIEALQAEDFVDVYEDKITVKIWHREVGEIIGIRQEGPYQHSEQTCDALVEYDFSFSQNAPWANLYREVHDRPEKIWTACLGKYNDGWRLNKK